MFGPTNFIGTITIASTARMTVYALDEKVYALDEKRKISTVAGRGH